MKQRKKRFSALLSCLLLLSLLAACGSPGTPEGGSSGAESSSPEGGSTPAQALAPKDDFADMGALPLDWTVEQGILDGDRHLLLRFTNNSPYTILSYRFAFAEKPEITEEEKNAYFDDVRGLPFVPSDEDLAELKKKPLGAHAERECYVEPGGTMEAGRLYYYEGIVYLDNADHYGLMVPDIATFTYLNGDAVKTANYDFVSKTLRVESETTPTQARPTSAIADKLPPIDAPCVQVPFDQDTWVQLDARGLTAQDYESYVAACQALGYAESSKSDSYFFAQDSDGYRISVQYEKDSSTMSVSCNAPET